MALHFVATIPDDMRLGDVYTVNIGTTAPVVVFGRRALYDELIWDKDGGFSGNWVDRSSMSGDGTSGYVFVLGRRATSTAGLSLYFGDGVVSGGGPAPTGDVTGPGSATDNAVVRFDGTTGKLVQTSLVTVSDAGSIAVPSGQTVGGRDLAADGSKLDGVEAGAQVTSFSRVSSALAAASSAVSFNAKNLSSVADPVSAQDAATKAWCTASFAAIGGGGSGSSWQTLLDLNLSQEANFTFVDGANSWKGLTWTGKNIASGADIFAVVNGTGLKIDTNAVASDFYTGVDTAPQIYLTLDQISGFDAKRSKLRITSQLQLTNSNINYELSFIGVAVVPYVGGQRGLWGYRRGFDSSFASMPFVINGGAVSSSNTAGTETHDVCEMTWNSWDRVQWTTKLGTQAASAANSAEFVFSSTPPRADYMYGGTGMRTPSTTHYLTTSSALALMFCAYPVNTTNSFYAVLTRLRVEYFL